MIYMSGGQHYLLPEMDMAKVGGPLSVVQVFVQIWHPKSTPYYFSIPIILSVTHMILYLVAHPTNRKWVNQPWFC